MAELEDINGNLLEALDALHALAGAPNDRQLEAYASHAGHQLSRATANNVRLHRGRPRWETVEAFVAACQLFAKTRRTPLSIPVEYRALPLWRKRYDRFILITSANTSKVWAQATLSAQLPRSGSPARLLDPESGVVEFIGRVAELRSLLAWFNDNSAISLRLITGPGGIGKTRLALQLARHLEESGWRCELVGDRQEARILADIRAVDSGPVLLVVDYAETRIGLEELLRAVAADKGTIRVLLLARSAGQWWEQLAAGEGAIRDLVVPGRLRDLPRRSARRAGER